MILNNIFLLACSPSGEIANKMMGTSTPQVEIFVNQEELQVELFLFSPIKTTTTYLMNREGVEMYSWKSTYTPGNSVYLLENGNLLRTGHIKSDTFDVGGAGGIVEEIMPDNLVVWSYKYANDKVQQHHDIEMLPNGNILIIAWQYKTKTEAVAAGRDPNLVTDEGLWPDHIIEVNPANSEIVWEWYVWDHLVQDYDLSKENYGIIADHPERIDLNYTSGKSGNPDWNHTNAIDYNVELDQILLCVHSFNEIWIIDHSTTTEEARGHSGGISGMGGDLLYRWGNPRTYDMGTPADQKFFGQHSAQWIPGGNPGSGNILVFNNGQGRWDGQYSSVDEIVPPVNEQGHYSLAAGEAYEPSESVWRYVADNPINFYADHISGAQRLPNGNTLICNGAEGIFFEVNSEKETVWQYSYGGEVFQVTGFALGYQGLSSLDLEPTIQLKAEDYPEKNTVRQPGNDGPPQMAIDSCVGLSQGDTCTINRLDGTVVVGSCSLVKNHFACVPEKCP